MIIFFNTILYGIFLDSLVKISLEFIFIVTKRRNTNSERVHVMIKLGGKTSRSEDTLDLEISYWQKAYIKP